MKLSQLEREVYANTIADVTGQLCNKGRGKPRPTAHRAAEYAMANVLETRIQMRLANGNGNGNGRNGKKA